MNLKPNISVFHVVVLSFLSYFHDHEKRWAMPCRVFVILLFSNKYLLLKFIVWLVCEVWWMPLLIHRYHNGKVWHTYWIVSNDPSNQTPDSYAANTHCLGREKYGEKKREKPTSKRDDEDITYEKLSCEWPFSWTFHSHLSFFLRFGYLHFSSRPILVADLHFSRKKNGILLLIFYRWLGIFETEFSAIVYTSYSQRWHELFVVQQCQIVDLCLVFASLNRSPNVMWSQPNGWLRIIVCFGVFLLLFIPSLSLENPDCAGFNRRTQQLLMEIYCEMEFIIIYALNVNADLSGCIACKWNKVNQRERERKK